MKLNTKSHTGTSDNRDKLDQLANILLEKEVIFKENVEEILENVLGIKRNLLSKLLRLKLLEKEKPKEGEEVVQQMNKIAVLQKTTVIRWFC